MWELRLGSLDKVFTTTWAEFCILSKGYDRTELTSWMKVREIAWNALISFNVDGKSIPKTKEKFMPLNGEKEKPMVSDKLKERFKELKEKFQNN